MASKEWGEETDQNILAKASDAAFEKLIRNHPSIIQEHDLKELKFVDLVQAVRNSGGKLKYMVKDSTVYYANGKPYLRRYVKEKDGKLYVGKHRVDGEGVKIKGLRTIMGEIMDEGKFFNFFKKEIELEFDSLLYPIYKDTSSVFSKKEYKTKYISPNNIFVDSKGIPLYRYKKVRGKLVPEKQKYASINVTEDNYIKRYSIIDLIMGPYRISTPGIIYKSLTQIMELDQFHNIVMGIVARKIYNGNYFLSMHGIRNIIQEAARVPSLDPISWSRQIIIDLIGVDRIKEGGISIYDIDAKFGSCMMSAASLGMRYVCKVQSNVVNTAEGLKHLVEEINRHKESDITILDDDQYPEESEKFDIIYAFPMPLSKQLYAQSNSMFATHHDWLVGYLFRQIKLSWRMLKEGGHLIFVPTDVQINSGSYLSSEPGNIFIETLEKSQYVGSIGLGNQNDDTKIQSWIWKKSPGRKVYWKGNKFVSRSLSQMYPEIHNTIVRSYINAKTDILEKSDKIIEEALEDQEQDVVDYCKNNIFRDRTLVMSIDEEKRKDVIRSIGISMYSSRGLSSF